MRRISMMAAAVVAVALAAGGCGGAEDDAATPVTAEDTSTPTAEATPTPEGPDLTDPRQVLGRPERHTFRVTDTDGYQQRGDLVLYPGVRGTDEVKMTSGWTAVGGEGDNACLEANPANDMVTNYEIRTENTYFVFGTLTIENETTGFTPADITWQWVGDTGAGGNLMEAGNPAVDTVFAGFGVGFSDGGRCDGLTSGGFMLTPSWRDDTWGPVPVVVAVDGVYTPEHPDGNADDIDLFRFGVNDFIVDAEVVGQDSTLVPLPGPSRTDLG